MAARACHDLHETLIANGRRSQSYPRAAPEIEHHRDRNDSLVLSLRLQAKSSQVTRRIVGRLLLLLILSHQTLFLEFRPQPLLLILEVNLPHDPYLPRSKDKPNPLIQDARRS